MSSQDMTLDAFLEHIEDKQPLASDGDIVQFERSLGVSLAADYRAFLQRCNGGYAGGSVWDLERDVGVHHIGGFRKEEHFSLRSHYDSLREFLPADMIPIADDPFGNAICLGIRGANVGKIYFWDHESADAAPAHVADSFTEFVARLEEQQDEKEG